MADERKEMEEYNVPATIRPRYFAFKVFGGWTAAGLFFFFLIRCWSARNSDERNNAIDKIQIRNEAAKQARLELKEDFEYVMKVLDQKEQKLNETTLKLDSIKSKL